MKRIILHLDMDYFFAQIEERENPHFKGKPIVVGADPKNGKGRGVVCSASYLARQYGIRSAMPISQAWQLCPKAIFLPVNMKLYQKVSQQIMAVIKKYSPIWEIASLDEAYLDLSSLFHDREKKDIWREVENLAVKLKKEIFAKQKLTSSIGIGPNKLIAKMAAEKAKPDGLLVIKPNQVKKFLEPLPIENLPGIGPKTAEKLKSMGINKIKELKKLSKRKLIEIFGKIGKLIFERARGIDEEIVSNEKIVKSIGEQITFDKNTKDPDVIFPAIERIVEQLHRELLKNNFYFKTITVICRFEDFETKTKSKTLNQKCQGLEILEREAKILLLKFLLSTKKLVRLIGLRLKVV